MTTAHYRLTSDEFLKINSSLTNAQMRVYLYYKTLDPFGDRRVEVCTKAIAEALGMAQRTVQLSLKKLESMGMIVWQKTKSFVKAITGSRGDHRIAEAITGSPKRSQDRERQLELSLQAASETSQSSSILFKQDLIDQEGIFEFENSEISSATVTDYDTTKNSEPTIDEIRALIRMEISDDESLDENDDFVDEDDELLDEDLLLNNESEPEQGLEENASPNMDLHLNTPEKPKSPVEVDSFRRRVEDFVLKTLHKSFPTEERRAAYFRKFDAKSWKKWETDYRESIKPVAEYKPYVPEKVEVAKPDSPVAQSFIAQIKEKLGIKS